MEIRMHNQIHLAVESTKVEAFTELATNNGLCVYVQAPAGRLTVVELYIGEADSRDVVEFLQLAQEL